MSATRTASQLLKGSKHPHTFLQTIVLSDGSTFTLRSTSPKTFMQLTKDTRNHALWNPSSVVVDKSGELSKFQQRFGDLEDLMEMSSTIVEAAPVKAAPAPSAPAAAAKGKKKK
ncbi:hypothetical protein BC829DRAFT_383723 [Chytridium lagenaria]|nr:hypothetical protein BC829DRAFT_383723 [Chytridium lagenaria]